MPTNASHPPDRAQHPATQVTRGRQAIRAAAGPGVTHQPARPGQTGAAHCSELCGTGQPGLARLPGAV
jgi:hypothetical protein